MAAIIRIANAIAQITPAIVDYKRNVNIGPVEKSKAQVVSSCCYGILNLWVSSLEIASSHRPGSGEGRRSVQDLHSEVLQTRETAEMIWDRYLKEEMEAMLQSISPLDFRLLQSDNLRRRYEDTGSWILQEPSFQTWASGDLGTLCCEGIPAAGKTVLVSIVIKHLSSLEGSKVDTDRSTDISLGSTNAGTLHRTITFLYWSETLVGSIARQLAESYPQRFFPYIEELYLTRKLSHERPLATDFIAMLGLMLRSFHQNYIVVDALDECTDEVKDSLINSFETLQQMCSLKLIFTLRPGMITGLPDSETTKSPEVRAQKRDTERYLTSRITSERRSL
ncbi:MAG: hypothetical protein Q9166_007501 [cf. Caloplaca sp. 2 TL-2023]